MRTLLISSWAGRLFLGATVVKFLVALVRQVFPSSIVEAAGSLATVGLVVSVSYFIWRLFLLMKRRLLWRVRRKLILSYIFIGVIPALLIIAFFMLGAWVVAANVSAYLFRDGYDDVVSYAAVTAGAVASELARTSTGLEGMVQGAHAQYPGLSMAFLPLPATGRAPARTGEWGHGPPPVAPLPAWISKAGRFEGTIAPAASTTPENGLDMVVRAVAPVVTSSRVLGHVIVDVPVERPLLDHLYRTTGVRAGEISLGGEGAGSLRAEAARISGSDREPFALFRRGVTFLDTYDWHSGEPHRASIAYSYAFRELYEKLSAAQSAQMGAMSLGQAILLILWVVAGLFLIIQFVALVMGLALARSITSSIHELFMGTERVRHGDFTHRITVKSNDQLGELAVSFNQMIGSIEDLLQTAAEKKRLDEELRIARQIQMSLLPRGALDFPGLSVTALCVPAREVGGDYYDFFPLSTDRLGLLIADVSGKGTSAALYMAELKGLVLSLSQIYQSPRQLLLEVNRLISEHLDSRSFITMTYCVVDLSERTLIYARAGHTPLIHVRGSSGADRVRILTPSGMVLGLRIPGAAEKFADLLEEDSIDLETGDVIVLYTDGITEAMNVDSDLFGDARLSDIVDEHGHLEPGELRERILREIEAFVGTADQHDDMTMILLKVEPAIVPRAGVQAPAGTYAVG